MDIIKMKRILCFGDSNTFGYNAKDASRLGTDQRWSGILKNILKDKYEVIEEGFQNRTGFVDNPECIEMSGLKYFPKIMEKLGKIDILIFALGTNDLQLYYDVKEQDIYDGFNFYIEILKKNNSNAKVLIIAPVLLNEDIIKGNFSFQFNIDSIEKSAKFIKIFKTFAQENNYEFLDINQYTRPEITDGLHYDADAHLIIAQKIFNIIDKIGE